MTSKVTFEKTSERPAQSKASPSNTFVVTD